MDKIFLTGVTGLVGAAFVVETIRGGHDCEFVCLVRKSVGVPAVERLRSIIADECRFDGCPELVDKVLSRVTPLEGDLVTMDPQEIAARPEMKGVNKVFHCAADVNLGKDPTGKVYRINFGGTRNILAVAKAINAAEFHYVGTAYIAGKLKGTAYEDNPIDSGFNNPYEESKYKAEMLVRASGIPFSIYRPGIITGRRGDGRIRKPLAFYRILEFLGKLKSHHCNKQHVSPENWFELELNFGTQPSDRIYFTPIDYVKDAIAQLFWKPVNGTAYHITGDSPVTTRQIQEAVCRVLRIDGISIDANHGTDRPDDKLISRFIGDLFPYFSSEITFDQSNVRKALGDSALDWVYGTDSLEALIRSYYQDYFPKVDWLQKISRAPIDREPRMG